MNIAVDDVFSKELTLYQQEVDSAIVSFFALRKIHESLDTTRLNYLNQTPLFWRAVMHSLQVTYFVTLGRVFDDTSPHSIHKLLNLGMSNLSLFSKTSLFERKKQGNEVPHWLPDYISRAYEPTVKDFRILKKQIAEQRKIFDKNYRAIRNKIFAHREAIGEEIKSIFSKTNVIEVEKMILFLAELGQVLWDLFHNGQKPVMEGNTPNLKEHIEKDTLKLLNAIGESK